jgi:hypothetical protein
MLGRRRAASTGTPLVTTLPQGTWAPWTATIGTTTWGSARTWAARSASNNTELPFFATPALPLRSWLHAELRQLADELALPAVASLAIALMEQTRPGGAGARPHRHITAITERLAAAFALAAGAGELDTAPDADLAAAHLIGPLVYRTTLQAAAVPDRLLTDVIEAVADWR